MGTPQSAEFEAAVRKALAERLRLARVPAVPRWDDQAVAVILQAAAGAPGGGERDTGAAGDTAVAAEILATFKPGANGWQARVSAAAVEGWRERLGTDG